jgi:cytochrome P450
MPANILQAGFRRYAEQHVTLSDGTVIPKGSFVVVALDNMCDEAIYPNPHEFQSDRFLRMRGLPGQETAAKLTSPTIEHLGFGFGRHTCPGRFYAAAVIKLTLCHILLKYDLRLVGGRPVLQTHGFDTAVSQNAEIEVRRRQEEDIL